MRPVLIGVVVLFMFASAGRGDEAFEKSVRPLLESACFKCHSHAARKSKGDLVVDSRGALLKGGETGPAIVPGDPAKSLLMAAIRWESDDLRMPPAGKLPPEQIAVLEDWIRRGAPWPSETPSEAAGVHVPGKITEDDRRWWAFQPIARIDPPTVAGVSDPIDRFIHARLNQEGLKPSPEADRLTLIRRLSFDLIGLPPTPEEIDAFLNDPATDAYERLVDRLLASPRHGEKWARFWLDLVRYAESDGYRVDDYRPTAWRYRDYVVRSLNADKPYDRFVQEQLAGDELFPDDPDALVATGFLRHGIYEYNQRDVRVQWQTILDDVAETTAEAFLAVGIGCARCHDHKFDPISQKDFYRLQAFFAGIQPTDDAVFATAADKAEHERQLAEWSAKAGDLTRKLADLTRGDRKSAEATAIKKFQPDIQAMLHKPEAHRTPFEKQLAALAYRQVTYEFDRIERKAAKSREGAALLAELKSVAGERPTLAIGLAVRDVGPEAPTVHVPKRPKGEPIDPGFLTILDPNPADIMPIPGSPTTGRRATLARWLTSENNPLTARVIVNRVWQQHFGQGIVDTPSDFGRLGQRPSHPELLDWLARSFMEDGWSFKKLHRRIVLSATYRQSSTAPPSDEAIRRDPGNHLLSRRTPRRLEAEQLRDAVLAVAGRLNLDAEGPGVDPSVPRRSVYTKAMRNQRDPMFGLFDAPEGIASVGQRNVTTTPMQALLLFNGSFLIEQSQALAERIEKTPGDADRVDLAFRLVFGRNATAEQRRDVERFFAEQTPRAGDSRRAWADLCHVLLNANEFLYVD